VEILSDSASTSRPLREAARDRPRLLEAINSYPVSSGARKLIFSLNARLGALWASTASLSGDLVEALTPFAAGQGSMSPSSGIADLDGGLIGLIRRS